MRIILLLSTAAGLAAGLLVASISRAPAQSVVTVCMQSDRGPTCIPVTATTPLAVTPGTSTTWAATQSGTWTVQPGNTPNTVPWLANGTTQYPSGATPITATATGTTNATTATLAGVSAKTTFLCGFSIRANATAAATGNATVTGIITGTLNFTQWTAPLASGIGLVEPLIGSACVPASAVNTGIAVVSAAPGAGGVVSVTAWGYQL